MKLPLLIVDSDSDSQTNVMDHNASNDIIDSQLNSKNNDDNDYLLINQVKFNNYYDKY